MAIVQMQKLSVCATKKHRKAVLEALQSLGVMEVTTEGITDEALEKTDTHTAIATFEKNARTLDDALKLLKEHGALESGFALFSEPEIVSREHFESIVTKQGDYMKKAASLLEVERQIQEAKGTIKKDENQIIALKPWMELDVPMNTRGTQKSRLLIGTMPGSLDEASLYAIALGAPGGANSSAGAANGESAQADRIPGGAKEAPAGDIPLECRVLAAEGGLSYVTVLCLRTHRDQVLANLRAAGFIKPQALGDGIPRDLVRDYEKDIQVQNERIHHLEERIQGFSKDADEFRIASDYYRTRAEKYRLLGDLPQSENVFFLEGFVPKEKAAAVKQYLEKEFDAFVQEEALREGELEPTLLRNNHFSEASEGVLESYGLPTHGRADPTVVMSIFYVIFFGMMLSDAGYGLVMAIGSAFAVKKWPRMKEGTKKMLRLFFWCGLSTVFWGFMYGGFFGNAIDTVATTFFGYTGEPILKPLWFEPMKEPMRLLVYCMLFGLIHLFAGLAVKGYEYLRDKDFVGFISDVFAWYLLVLGLTLMLLPSDIFRSISGMTFQFPAWLNILAKVIALLGLLIILLMSGRAKKNWAIRIALGAYDIYGLTSWLSDILSYSRLLALGLATGVIANVINMMASMFGGGIFGAIAFILIFLLGHTLNIGINALGAYVHTNRLQYVEFFSKFYDAGGKKFTPFSTVNQYVQIKEEKSL